MCRRGTHQSFLQLVVQHDSKTCMTAARAPPPFSNFSLHPLPPSGLWALDVGAVGDFLRVFLQFVHVIDAA